MNYRFPKKIQDSLTFVDGFELSQELLFGPPASHCGIKVIVDGVQQFHLMDQEDTRDSQIHTHSSNESASLPEEVSLNATTIIIIIMLSHLFLEDLSGAIQSIVEIVVFPCLLQF